MDKLKEILNGINERLSNPLVYSFIFSWLILNWKITIILLWYNQELVESTEAKSLLTFISENINLWNGIMIPFSLAFIYTLGMPWLRAWINIRQAKSETYKEDGIIRVSKSGKISIAKYLKLKEDYNERSRILENIISEESENIDALRRSQNDLITSQRLLNEANIKINEKEKQIIDSTNPKLLNGYWNSNYTLNGIKGVEKVYIEGGRYSLVNANGVFHHKFDIRDFYYDQRNATVFFVKEYTQEEKRKKDVREHYIINRLNFQDADHLAGTENGLATIMYTRTKSAFDNIPPIKFG
jgi:hypothetical protein